MTNDAVQGTSALGVPGIRWKAWSMAVMCTALAACTSPRPASPPQALDCNLNEFIVEDAFSGWQLFKANQLQAQGLADTQPSFNMLVLSAGGEYGAYGAGFLQGWASLGASAKPSPRSDIQVVTGVSTGAILSTHAFLGKDAEIEALYRNTSGSKIYKSRSVLGLLTANSLLDASGKEQLIDSALTPELIDLVASAPPGRFLYLGVVDLDSGRFLRIDMVKLARSLPKPRRDACYRGIVSASAAIPIAFPPRFIDGRMLTDGGARRHLFLTEIPADALKPGVTRRMFSFVHGDLDVGCAVTGNGLLPITARALELFSDQSFKDSLALSAAKASGPASATNPERLFQTSLYAAADRAAVSCIAELTKCKPTSATLSEDLFCQPYMRCLADQGKVDGAASAGDVKRWRTVESLNLSSVPSCDAPNRVLRQR